MLCHQLKGSLVVSKQVNIEGGYILDVVNCSLKPDHIPVSRQSDAGVVIATLMFTLPQWMARERECKNYRMERYNINITPKTMTCLPKISPVSKTSEYCLYDCRVY